MAKTEQDEERERRISMEAIVGAYGPEEQALGWYYYLEDKIRFPFEARVIETRRISPLTVGETAKAIRMAPEDACMCEMFVEIEWQGRCFGVPWAQLEAVQADEVTQEAIADWHYWIAQGYEF